MNGEGMAGAPGGTQAATAGAGIASPCINVCQMDAASGLCRGCFRTLDEIAGWSRASDGEKLRILTAVATRRTGPTPQGTPSNREGTR